MADPPTSTPSTAARPRNTARRAPTGRRRARPRPAEGEPDLSPSQYIAKIGRRDGREIPGPIDPDELLVHAHRDRHPVEVAAQVAASRLISLTGREHAVEELLRRVNAVGAKTAEWVGAWTARPGTAKTVKQLLGVIDRDAYFQFREPSPLS
jgi:hypothetical protein